MTGRPNRNKIPMRSNETLRHTKFLKMSEWKEKDIDMTSSELELG